MTDIFVVHSYEWFCSSAACNNLNGNVNLLGVIIQQNNWCLSWWKETDHLSVLFYELHLLTKRKRKGRLICTNHTDVTLCHVDVCCHVNNDIMLCTKQVLCHNMGNTDPKHMALKA